MDTYYHSHDLSKFGEIGKGNKELWNKFKSYYDAVFIEGALTEREKALIALAVAACIQEARCEQRFPPPDFSPGYTLPVTEAQGKPARDDARAPEDVGERVVVPVDVGQAENAHGAQQS